MSATEQQAVNLLNADRRANGLPDLQVDSRLTTLARNYAQDMLNRNYFSHYSPEGQSPFDRIKLAGITYSAAGENIGINQTVQQAEVAFMNSSGHRANILNSSYTKVGIGVTFDKSGNVYVVQDFIKP
nr:CAP domain-containing protein [Sporomusa silvacetica]